MTLHEEQEKVQRAMNSALSGLQEDPWLTQRVLANAKGEEPVKRKISLALVLCIALGLAVTGSACAVFSSQVAAFFSQYWNQELGSSLEEGKIAQIGESVTLGDVVFTLDEVVYKDRALYGVGTVRPVRGTDVLVPMDLANEPEYFALSEEAQALVEKARAAGGRLLTTSAMPLMIGVDEGAMLMPGCIGYYDVPGPDGSLTYSFEASDGFAISEGTSYQIQMESHVEQLSERGESVEGTARETLWTVSCVPEVRAETATDAPEEAVSVEHLAGYALITPAAYQEKGTMPVYQAVKTDFTTAAKPEWFNGTGIQSSENGDYYIFNDHACLSLAPEAIFYNEDTEDSSTQAVSFIIVQRAWVRNWSGHSGEFTLDRTELTDVTLAQARLTAEEMLARLGIDSNQYVCDEALDLSLERIQAMGALWEQAILDGELFVGEDYRPYDYSAIPASEEGYLLKYSPLGVDTAPAGSRYSAVFYINSRGIVYASIRNQFSRGEQVSAPETLVSPDDAIAVLAGEMGRSFYGRSRDLQAIRSVALTYEAVRADNKADGMILVPAWLILYQDAEDAAQDSTSFALINAVNGTLIDASF